MKSKGFSILVFGLILAVCGFGALAFGRQWIEAGHVGVIYTASGGLQNKVYEPQALFITPGQQLYTYPTIPQNAVYSQNPNEGEVRAADGILVTTSDNANTAFDISVVYRIKKEDVLTVFKTFGAVDINIIQSQHIRRAVKDAASEVGTKYTIFQLMGEKREEASKQLTQEIAKHLTAKGVTVEAAMLLRAYPNQETIRRTSSAINSQTQIGIAEVENQIAEITAKAALIKAEAEQKARSLTASKTQAKSLEMLDLELERAAIEQWGGDLSPYTVQPGQTIVLGSGALGGK